MKSSFPYVYKWVITLRYRHIWKYPRTCKALIIGHIHIHFSNFHVGRPRESRKGMNNQHTKLIWILHDGAFSIIDRLYKALNVLVRL